MFQLIAFIKSFVEARFGNERGATAVEYGLIVVLIAAAIVVTIGLLGDEVLEMFQTTETNVRNR